MELDCKHGFSAITAMIIIIFLINPTGSLSATNTITVFRLRNGTSWEICDGHHENCIIKDNNARSPMFFSGSGISQMLINFNSEQYTAPRSDNRSQPVAPACKGPYEDCLVD